MVIHIDAVNLTAMAVPKAACSSVNAPLQHSSLAGACALLSLHHRA